MMKKDSNLSPTMDFERPLVTVDVVIFAVQYKVLKVLLVRRPDTSDDPFPGRWALPGGFVDVDKDASLEDCAIRKLRDKTGIATPYIEQLGSWGDAQRDPRGWSATHVYFALVQAQGEPTHTQMRVATPSQWIEVHEASRKRLAFDHARILTAAISRLRSKVEYTSLPAFLVAEPFTLPQLQQAYEVVLGRPIDKSAFRKRMLDAAFLEEAGFVDGTSRKAAVGYRLKARAHAVTFPRTFKASE